MLGNILLMLGKGFGKIGFAVAPGDEVKVLGSCRLSCCQDGFKSGASDGAEWQPGIFIGVIGGFQVTAEGFADQRPTVFDCDIAF